MRISEDKILLLTFNKNPQTGKKAKKNEPKKSRPPPAESFPRRAPLLPKNGLLDTPKTVFFARALFA